MPPALLTALGVAGSVGGALIGSSASKKAAQTQADAADRAAETQLKMFETTRSDLAPYLKVGTGALGQLASLLGIPGVEGVFGGMGGGGPSGGEALWQNYLNANPDLMSAYNANKQVYEQQGESPLEFAARHYQEHGQSEGRPLPGAGAGVTNPVAAAAMEQLKQYPVYQFRFDEGLRALDRSAASRGMLLSGAQVRGAEAFGQGMAAQSWDDYLGRLQNLVAVGGNAGAQTGQLGVNTGQGIAASQMAAGQAGASGALSGAASWQQGIQGALQAVANNYGGGFAGIGGAAGGIPTPGSWWSGSIPIGSPNYGAAGIGI